jgi:hypothetical protein
MISDIELELNQILCLPKLKILSLEHNWIKLIPANAFSELLLLKDLILLQAGNQVKTIQEFEFNTYTEVGNDVSLMIFIRFTLRSSIFRDVMLPNISYPFPHPVILFPYNTSFSKYLRCRKTPF